LGPVGGHGDGVTSDLGVLGRRQQGPCGEESTAATLGETTDTFVYIPSSVFGIIFKRTKQENSEENF